MVESEERCEISIPGSDPAGPVPAPWQTALTFHNPGEGLGRWAVPPNFPDREQVNP